MQDYCIQDVLVTKKLYSYLIERLNKDGFREPCMELEHQVQAIIARQQRDGWAFDMPAAMGLLCALKTESSEIEQQMQEVFSPTIVEMKTKTKSIPFNPGSRQQIADRLISRGWKPTERTEKGQYVVNEKTLAACVVPEAKLVLRFLMLNKRVSQIEQWVEAAKNDGRVHGSVITNGAVTGRMTHNSPNMAQVPSADKEYGRECRSLFIVDQGEKLVGVDASGLELRMLAHYMKDEEYIQAVISGRQEEGTDVHTLNQKAAGLQTRAQAKTFIYAFLYGAGEEKIGSIVGGTAADGRKLIENFLKATPELQVLRRKVSVLAAKGYVPALDGRKIWVRSAHSALNTLLQGSGAVVMKQALVLYEDKLKRFKIPAKFLGNIHDEFQLSAPADVADFVGQLGVKAIRDAGIKLGLRCPLDGEYRVGYNWSETH